MTGRKFTRAIVAAVAVLVAGALAVPAVAGTPPRNVQLKAIGGVSMIPNRSITDGMHFNRDVFTIQRGGRVVLIDRTEQPHSWSAVKARQVPKTVRGVEACFGKGPCDELAAAHGAINPDTGEEQEPTTPLVNTGREGFNRPGDSVLMPPGGRTSVRITADAGSTLNMICAIHPWMQNKVRVVRRVG